MEVKSLYHLLALETSFEETVELAANIAEAPIAFISFIDSNYIWLKSQIGIHQKKNDYLDFVKVILGTLQDTEKKTTNYI
ncbi:MAG: hypothetical protein F6K24_21035 [Okeania sp. SIO2D1]|nr:hypothetical protein [Okeania sp. SIO2D1]